MGKEQALEGDICACKCAPPPVMIASQRDSSHILTASDIASMGYGPAGQPLPNELPGEKCFDEQFQLLDVHTGSPLVNVEYVIERASGDVEHGVTDANGYTHRLAKTDHAENVAIYCNGAEMASARVARRRVGCANQPTSQ